MLGVKIKLMNELVEGAIFAKGKLSRTVIKIENNEVFYRTEKGLEKHCFITTFQDWVAKIEKSKESVSYKYEVIYTENAKDYITTDTITDIEVARNKAIKLKENPSITHVEIVEYKTIEKRIQI